MVAEIEFLLILAAEVIDLINSTGCCCKIDRDEKEILGDFLKIKSLKGDYSPTKVDEVPDSAGCDNCSYYWLKGVGVVFLLKKSPPESFNSCCERLEADLIAIAAAVETEVDSIDCRRGK